MYVLNVVDGCIPSDMSTGQTAEIEERHLLYAAMTRAAVIAPQPYYVRQQRRDGDAHVYANVTWFIPGKLVQLFEQTGRDPSLRRSERPRLPPPLTLCNVFARFEIEQHLLQKHPRFLLNSNAIGVGPKFRGEHSDISRNRAILWGRVATEVDFHIIDEAPAPTFGRVVALDDRMLGCFEVSTGVPVRRVVAAADMTTRPAQAQVDPFTAKLETFLTAQRAGDNLAHARRMGAVVFHCKAFTQ